MAANNILTPAVISTRDNLGPAQSSATAGTSSGRGTMLNLNLLVQDVANLLTFVRNTTFQNPGFAIDTNFDVKNANAVTVMIDGVANSLAANTSFDTGTTAVISADKWGIAILTWDGTTATVTWASTGSTHMTYADEATAKAALGTGNLVPGAGFVPLGYFTVETASGQTWTAGTDALQGGTGGNAATATNYYNDPTLGNTYGITAALTASQVGNMSGTVITA